MRKLRIAFTLLLVTLAVCLSGCQLDVSDIIPIEDSHTCNYDTETERSPSTCKTAGWVRYKCSCGKTKTEALPLASHTSEVSPARDATCTEDGLTEGSHCSACMIVLTAQQRVPASGHTSVIDPATSAVGNSPAKTEGSHCGVCGYVIVRQEFVFSDSFTNPDSYSGDYGYNYLSEMTKGNSLTALYDDIDEQMSYFHTGGYTAGEDNIVATFNYSDLGLTTDEALAVYVTYRYDNPIYYWISGSVTYTSEELNILVDDEYADGDTRTAYNSVIYDRAEEMITAADGYSAYSLALAFHDMIILSADYAYESDGVTPEDEAWAHNVLGVMEQGSGVCESYSKTFQLLLNFCGIDNVFVSGNAGGPHAWNLVRMDDGEWYWFDLTWDDTPDRDREVSYNYFCVNDTQNVGWIDGNWIIPAGTFAESHTADAPVGTGIDFAYALPEVSDEVFAGVDELIRSTFELDGITYSLCGWASVQVIDINLDGAVVIPDTVVYGGYTYSVTAIGAVKSEDPKLYGTGPVSDNAVTSLKIGKNLIFIWEHAFEIASLESITVDENNTEFSSLDGILYSKDGSEIIWSCAP